MAHQHLDDLIHSIYEGILEPTPWQGFLALLLQAVNAKVVSLVLRAPATGDQGLILNCLRPENQDTRAQTTAMADPNDWPSLAYKEHFFALDPFIHLPLNQVISLHELVPEDELLHSDYYQNYLKPAGVYHILGVDTCSADGTEARLRLSRPFGEKDFSSRDKALCQSLISHLQRAIGLRARLNRIESERNVLAKVMDKLAVGTILLDEQGRVIKANSIATCLLEGHNGLYLQDHLLLAGDQAVNRQLQQIIADSLTALKNPGQASIIKALSIPREQEADLSLVIRPVPAPAYAEGQAAPSLAIFISARELQTDTSTRTLVELFQLSQAEAHLCLALARGLSIAEASDELFISQHTARAQLKAIFAKCQVSRQAELVRLIVKSVAALA